MSDALLAVVARAWQTGGVPVTLSDLIRQVGLAEHPLAGAAEVEKYVTKAGCTLYPTLREGGLDTERFLRPQVAPDQRAQDIRTAISAGEGPRTEFKSSLVYDRKRAAADASATARDLKSEAVLESTLKTICAFLNSGGGRLFIGVEDSGALIGIEHDFQFSGVGEVVAQSCDKWELFLRSSVASRFHEGSSIGGAIDVCVAELDGKAIAQISVLPRRKLSFLIGKNGYNAFVRRGDRSERIEAFEIEELVTERLRSSI